jgi:hypothetical protein
MNKKPFRPTICVDFDGVIHSYESGWQGIDVVADRPVPNAFDWLIDLLENDSGPVPVIYSSRSKEEAGIKAMKEWFAIEGFPHHLLNILEFPIQKPAAWLTIDDRALCFTGTFPSLDQMMTFKPWNKP